MESICFGLLRNRFEPRTDTGRDSRDITSDVLVSESKVKHTGYVVEKAEIASKIHLFELDYEEDHR